MTRRDTWVKVVDTPDVGCYDGRMTHAPNAPDSHYRYPAKAYDAHGEHIGPGPWLELIRTANGIEPGMFGAPDSTGPWWAGGSVEEYEHARVLHRGDGTVSIVAKTVRGEEVLAAADRVMEGRVRLWIDTESGTYGTLSDENPLVVVTVDAAMAERLADMSDADRSAFGALHGEPIR